MLLAFGTFASEQSVDLLLWKTLSHVYYDYDIIIPNSEYYFFSLDIMEHMELRSFSLLHVPFFLLLVMSTYPGTAAPLTV